MGRPPIWLLGSSGFSASLSDRLGLPFAYAHHFSPAGTLPALELYRRSFRPSAVLDAPYAMIATGALAADTAGEARSQALAGALWALRLRTGNLGLVPTPEEAAAYPYSRVERDFVDERLTHVVHGTPDEVREGLDRLVRTTGADELMLTSNAHGGDTRLRSYELVADAYGMPTEGPARS